MPKTKVEWSIVENVRDLRKKEGKTQRDIASYFDVTPGYIGQIETEGSPSMYSFDNLNALAHYLKCSMKDFMPEEPL